MNPSNEILELPINGQTNIVNNNDQAAPIAGPIPKPRSKKAPDLPSMERRNWLIHNHYVRKEFEICNLIIDSQLEETAGTCEYAHYARGLILRQEGKIQQSLDSFKTCNVLNPRNPDNVKQMAKSLYLLGKHHQAVDTYKEAEIRTRGSDWEIHHNLGICYMFLRQFELAKSELSKALLAHKNEESYFVLSRIHLLLDDIKGAIQLLRDAEEHFPENPENCTKLGLLYLQTSQPQIAFESLGTALVFDPWNPDALLAAGSVMQSNLNWDTALSKYNYASKVIPESPSLWNNIGMCFLGKKKFIASVSCLKRAAYLAPFDWKVYYNLGLVHLMMQQFASAFHFLSASINIRPTRGQTFLLLAIALTHLKDADNAQSAYERALALDNKDPAIPLNFAIFFHNQGQSEKSKNLLPVFEERVHKLKSLLGLETEPEVLIKAGNFAEVLQVKLGIEIPDGEKNKETAAKKSAPTSAIKEARALTKAQMLAEGKSGKVKFPTYNSKNAIE